MLQSSVGNLAKCGDVLDSYNQGDATGTQWVEDRDAIRHPHGTQDSPQRQKIILSKIWCIGEEPRTVVGNLRLYYNGPGAC